MIPRDIPNYNKCIDIIADKKEKSHSEWLVIFSLNFWRDRHWLGEEVLSHMVDTFKDSLFSKVYFIESMDGEGFFQTNFKVFKIK